MSRTYHQARIAVGTALLAILILLPFVRVNGESALRFDVPTLRLLFFGTVVWMEDFFLVLVAVLALTFLTLFITTAFGRIWCGWLCPQTVLIDLTPFLDNLTKKGFIRQAASLLPAGVVSMLIAASLVGYFVSPCEVISLVQSGGTASTVVTISFAVLFLFLFLDLIALRRTFCATVCPYAKMQGVLFDERTLIVAFDKNRRAECMRCAACVRACPVGIDIRKGAQSACIHCAECVDACTERMAPTNRPSLIAYVFGEPAGRKGGIRVSLYLSGGMTTASVLLLLYLTAVRVPFEATITPVYAGTVTTAADKSVTNRYTLSLRNTGEADLEVSLAVSAPSVSARVDPTRVRLARGQESIQVPISIIINAITADGRQYLPLTLVIKHEKSNKELEKPVSFLLPDH
jgi:cytochrome c oxidase accessory protein FixG